MLPDKLFAPPPLLLSLSHSLSRFINHMVIGGNNNVSHDMKTVIFSKHVLSPSIFEFFDPKDDLTTVIV